MPIMPICYEVNVYPKSEFFMMAFHDFNLGSPEYIYFNQSWLVILDDQAKLLKCCCKYLH